MSAYRHLFVRWDDPSGERFNIEGSGQGMSAPPDEYYRTGRMEASPEVEKGACYLQPMTRREELAVFLKIRATTYWREAGNYRRAVEAYAWAYALAPHNEGYRTCLGMTLDEWQEILQKLEPSGFPPLYFHWGERRFPLTVPEVLERNLLYCEALENVLKDPAFEAAWWGPLRSGKKPAQKPIRIDVRFRPSGACDIFVRHAEGGVPVPRPIRAKGNTLREVLRQHPELLRSNLLRELPR